MEISFFQALSSMNLLKPVQQGQRTKSPLDQLSGDPAFQKHFISGDIKDAFQAHFDRYNEIQQSLSDLREEAQKLEEEKQELEERKEKNKTGLSKKDAKRLEEVEEEIDGLEGKLSDIQDDLSELNDKTEEVELTRGKFKEDDIKDVADPIIIEVLEWAIEFKDQ